ncbi:MAG: hypothetical protein FWH51_00895 [Dehalococcoidia bacterium]|nr:hypothetical protein [Dehalococcoidia bacterium]
MRRGCISVGQVKCDICGQVIPYPKRYLVVDEDGHGKEVNSGGKSVRYCVDDALKKGYAHHRETKGEMVLTFLPETEVLEVAAEPQT